MEVNLSKRMFLVGKVDVFWKEQSPIHIFDVFYIVDLSETIICQKYYGHQFDFAIWSSCLANPFKRPTSLFANYVPKNVKKIDDFRVEQFSVYGLEISPLTCESWAENMDKMLFLDRLLSTKDARLLRTISAVINLHIRHLLFKITYA